MCVVDSREIGPAYERLGECELEVMAVLPHVGHLNAALVHEYDVVVVGCSEEMLQQPSFQTRVLQISRSSRSVAVVAAPGPDAAALAARLGFHGFVAREVSPSAFQRTLDAVTRGELAFPRTTMAALVPVLRRFLPSRPASADATALTLRQRQIVDLIARGATDREIADLLGISQSTVHKHVQNALRRVNARTRSQLVAATARDVAASA